MPRAYASGTKVSEHKSHFELAQLMKKFGATDSGYMEQQGQSSFLFVRSGQTFRFSFTFPSGESDVDVDRNYRPSVHGSKVDYERMRKMRALVAVVKAQLIAVEEGIATFDEMLIGNVVTDNGQTVAERWAPEARRLALEGRFPSALPEYAPGGNNV